MHEQANGPQEVQQMTQTLRCNVVRARKMAHLGKRTRQAPPEAPTWDAAYAVVMASQQVCRDTRHGGPSPGYANQKSHGLLKHSACQDSQLSDSYLL